MGKKIIITEELKQQVKNLFDQKIGARVISKQLGITRWIVQQAYKELGIYNIGIKTPRQPIPKQKPCKTCKTVKFITEFRQRIKGDRISYESYCLPCEKTLNYNKCKNRYQKNRQWHINYKKINRSRINKLRKEKFKNDSSFKLRILISNSINEKFRNKKNNSKNGSMLDNLPYSIEKLKKHLESQFEPWMNWNNWGVYRVDKWDDNDSSTWTWQIDHIIPAELFKYTSMKDSEFRKCWDLSNLRPYNSKQNLIDGTTKIRHNKT